MTKWHHSDSQTAHLGRIKTTKYFVLTAVHVYLKLRDIAIGVIESHKRTIRGVNFQCENNFCQISPSSKLNA